MGDRTNELQLVLDRLRERDFTKIAQMGGAAPMPGAPAPMDAGMGGMGAMGGMGGGMMPAMDPGMVPPEMLPPVEGLPPELPPEGDVASQEAAKGMKEVAVKALDMAQDTINAILSADNLSPEAMSDAAAAAASSSGAFSGIPPEEIAALANQQA